MDSFESLGLSQWIVRQTTKLGKQIFIKYYKVKLPSTILQSTGLKNPTPIQKNCIPEILSGKDCIGAAKTG